MNEEAIFSAALERKTARERQAFLDDVCAGNAELRAQVEELLKADADAGSFLNHTPVGHDPTVANAFGQDRVASTSWSISLPFLAPSDKPDRIGKLVGKVGEYEIIEVVGQGGMGAVLRAFDTKLSRVVAVKVMAPELAANPTAVRRFLREAQTAAAVHHDHVVTIHAIDDSHRPPFIVMEFIDGQTLQQKIDREGALDLKQILRIGSQTAAGLAAAHKHGLIHRDVKPANILLENGVERVRITDFGLARAADDLEMTKTGTIAGTPQYMSPEQAKGEPIDARSDLFSLGSVLYTMCTGRTAFRAETTMGVLRRVCEDMPRPIREVNAEIPDWLDAIVNKLLAKDPGDRFQSAAEVADLLSQHLAHAQNPALASFPAHIALAIPKTAPSALVAPQAFSTAPPLWLWGAGLLLAVIAMLAGVLRLGSLIDGRTLGIAFVILMSSWMAAIALWTFTNQLRRMRANRDNMLDTKPFKFTGRGVLIEHPVLGVVAIVMLLAAVGTATYMLTAAWHRAAANGSLPTLESVVPAFFISALVISLLAVVVCWVVVIHGGRVRAAAARFAPKPALALDQPDRKAGPEVSKHWAWWQWAILIATILLNIWWLGPSLLLTASNRASILLDTQEPGAKLLLTGHWNTITIEGGRGPRWIVPGTYRLEVQPPTGRALERLTYYHRTTFTIHYEKRAWTKPQEVFVGRGDRVRLTAAFHDSDPTVDSAIPLSEDGNWVQLFNGKDLTGWKTHPNQSGKWEVKDGILTCSGNASHLFTERSDFKDFELRVVARINATGNSGVFFRSHFEPSILSKWGPTPAGYEVQIRNVSPDHTGTLFVIKTDRTGTLMRPTKTQSRPDEWFTLEVEAVGGVIRRTINGTSLVAVEDRTYSSGHIALQHYTPDTKVEFRKIEIRERERKNDPVSPVSPDSALASGEWIQLFSGKDLTGWKTHPSQPGFWKVDDGQLIGFGAASHLFSERDDYEDFHLRVEAQINEAGTSGVYFRVPEFAVTRPGQFPNGYEANINSTSTMDSDKTGSLGGSLRGVAPFKNRLHKPDEWFTLEVIVRGPHIVIKVNGETTVDFVDANESFKRGRLALQVWPAQSVVRFRKIEINELTAGQAPGAPTE